jgi:uncharacterized protein with HEPN domain
MPRVLAEFIEHILDEMSYLDRNAQKISKEAFLNDETLQRSFVRSIEIIGGAVKQIPESLRQQYPQIQWRDMAGMKGSFDSQLLLESITK